MAPEGPSPAPGLRERRRLREMKRVQRCAVELFSAEGFGAVSVEQVAEAAEVAPVSIYRWFGTKERLVLWDEYDPGLLAAVAGALETRPPLEAVRHGVTSTLDEVYDTDRELVLARTKLVYAEPTLLAATSADMRGLEAALRELFAPGGRPERAAFAAAVLAGVAVSVLVTSVEAWQAQDGRVPLADLVDRGFDALAEQR